MSSLRVLVTGAEGFIGRHVAAALRSAGHEVVIGGRPRPRDRPVDRFVPCDFSRDLHPSDWEGRLTDLDAVVNCVGILREAGDNTFERIHVQGPTALFEACARAGIRRIIQVSALGAAEVGEYLASKHRGDEALARRDLDWTILRPSLVYSPRGSYGGSSLLRAMAALPGMILLPGNGAQRIQPICAEDLGRLVGQLLENRSGVGQVVKAVGPQPITLREYLVALRRWLELPAARLIQLPAPIAQGIAWLGERVGNGPLGLTMWRMLQRGNVGTSGSEEILASLLGRWPASVPEAFEAEPSFVQDRWHARLYFLGPALRIAIALLWIASGCVGFLAPLPQSRAPLTAAGIPEGVSTLLLWLASSVDVLLGVLALLAWRIELVAGLMLMSLAVYTLSVGMSFPVAWMEPFGGVLKNVVLFPAVLVMAVLSRRR